MKQENGSGENLDQLKRLSFYDYLAAAMIGIFVVWLWAQTAAYFPSFFQEASFGLVTAASYFVYILGGVTVSYLALSRTGSRRVKDGLVIGAGTALATLFYVNYLPGVETNLLIALTLGFTVGGYLGAVLIIKTSRKDKTPPS